MQVLCAVNVSVIVLYKRRVGKCLNDNQLKASFYWKQLKECFLNNSFWMVDGGGVGAGMPKLNYMIFDAFICICISSTSLVAWLEVPQKEEKKPNASKHMWGMPN